MRKFSIALISLFLFSLLFLSSTLAVSIPVFGRTTRIGDVLPENGGEEIVIQGLTQSVYPNLRRTFWYIYSMNGTLLRNWTTLVPVAQTYQSNIKLIDVNGDNYKEIIVKRGVHLPFYPLRIMNKSLTGDNLTATQAEIVWNDTVTDKVMSYYIVDNFIDDENIVLFKTDGNGGAGIDGNRWLEIYTSDLTYRGRIDFNVIWNRRGTLVLQKIWTKDNKLYIVLGNQGDNHNDYDYLYFFVYNSTFNLINQQNEFTRHTYWLGYQEYYWNYELEDVIYNDTTFFLRKTPSYGDVREFWTVTPSDTVQYVKSLKNPEVFTEQGVLDVLPDYDGNEILAFYGNQYKIYSTEKPDNDFLKLRLWFDVGTPINDIDVVDIDNDGTEDVVFSTQTAVFISPNPLINYTKANITADTFVSSNNKNSNYGTSTRLYIGYSGLYLWSNILMQMPLNIPEGHTIVKATLKLGGFTGACYTPFIVKEVLQSWNEYTVTYNTRPTTGTTYFSGDPSNIDLTSLAVKQHEEGNPLNFEITSPTSGLPYSSCYVGSRENSNQLIRPYVILLTAPLLKEEGYVNTSFELPPYTPAEQYDNFTGTSNNYNIEEEQTASIEINVTGTQEALNVTYDNQNAIVIYRDSKGFSQNITDLVPYKKTYNLTDESITVYFDITPLNEDWEGYDASVVWDNHTDDYSAHVPNITVGYRKPIYNVTMNYSSPHYMEEDNDVNIYLIPNYNYAKVNLTITPSAVGSDLTPSSIEETDFTGSEMKTVKVKPNYLNYTGFTMSVGYNSKTQSNSKDFTDIVNKTYHYPLYDLTLIYPTVMYILENNTVRAKLMPNAFYQHAKANITLKYSNQESKVYFYDDYDQLTPIEVSVPYEKTYYDTYSEINGYFIVTPLTTDYTGYTINAESDNPLQEITFEVNKSEYLPDPDYIEVRYKYSPVTYPLENKTLMLQFHYFNGNWDEYYQCIGGGNCTWNETNNEWACQDANCQLLANTIKITCRTCGENSTVQLVQYWTNTTDCAWFNGTLEAIKYWEYYPIRMILQDKDVCNDTSIVPSMFPDMTAKGSLKALGNRDKYVFHNSSMSGKPEDYYSVFADAIGLKSEFNTLENKTKVSDRENTVKANDTDTYVAQYKLESNQVTFYIANQKKQTVWVDKVLIPNTIAWDKFRTITALYTTHGKQKISVVASYNLGTDTITVIPANPKNKIPIEPATGSNTLIISGGKFVGFSAFMIGVFVPIMLVMVFLAWGSKYFLEALRFDPSQPIRSILIIAGLMVTILIVVVMMGYFVVAIMGLV